MKRWLLILLVLAVPGSLAAATISSTGAGGNWNVGATWVGGAVPLSTDNAIIVSGATVNLTTNQTIVNLTINGTGILNMNTNTRTLTVNGTFTMNGTSQVTGNNNNRHLDLNGDFNIPSGQVGSIGGIRVLQAVGATFNLGGTFTPTDNTGTKTLGNAIFYDGCLIDASVTESVTIAGNLSVQPSSPGQHSKIGRISLIVNGTTTVTGYLEFANSGVGTKTFNNTITVAAGGTWDNIVGEDPVVNCSIVNNGVWPQPTGGNGRYDVNVAGAYTYSGTKNITMTRLRIQTTATVTNTTSLTLTQTANVALTVNGGGSFINGNGLSAATLIFTGYTDVVSLGGGGSTVDFTPVNNTVVYAAPVGQNVYPTTYDKLVCSNDNNAFVNGSTVVNTSLSITGSTVVDVTGGTDLTGTGTLTMTGTSTLRLSSAGTVPALTGAGHSLAAGTTIEFYRAGAQTAASSANYPYQEVLISGNAGSNVTMDGVSNIAGNLSVTNAGRFSNTAGVPATITVAGAFSHASTATTTLNTNLTAGSVSLSSTGGFTYSNRTITIDKDDGFWAVAGAPTITAAGTAQVVFTTGINQTIAGTSNPTFNTLVINNNNDVTQNIATTTVTGTLTLTSGKLITGTNVVVMASGSTVTRTSGFVEGNLNKTFPLASSTQNFEVGTGSFYTPASITCTSVTTSGTMTVSTTAGDHPEIYSGLIEPSNTVNRYWSITNNSIVFSGFSVGRVAATFTWNNADEDPAVDNAAIIKWYNNSTLTWTGTDQLDEVTEQNPPMTVTTNTATNNSNFTIMNPNQLPAGQMVDFQVGEKIDPTQVFNRLTGANNWNNLLTWIQLRSGVITLTNGSPTITGTSTSFQTELVVGDKIMLSTDPATVYTVTAINPILQQITVGPAVPAISTTGGYGRQYIPGINPPSSDVDAVIIGNTNIADAATTITLDTDAQILTLDVGATTRTTAHALTHQNSTRDLIVLANASVNQPGGAATNVWNINDATADVQGDVNIGTGTNNTVTRISRINLTTGTLDAGNLKFKPNNAAGREVQTVLNISGAGTVNLHGAITWTGNRGTLSSAAGSTFNFVRSASTQTIGIPTVSPAAWVYANIHTNNTSAAGAAFGFTSTATSVTGNVRVQTGKMTLGVFNIVGAAGSTFQVADGATFEMRSTSGAGIGGFPSGFGTISLGPTSTVAYNQTGATNPWPVRNTTYGHLIIGQGSTRNFELQNATTNVAGNLTIGNGVTAPNLQATGAATLNVTGNLLINNNASLDGSNITNLNLGGDWTDDGDFTEGTNTVTFNSPAANVLQNIGGTVSENFYNLVLNTSAATDLVRLNNDATVLNVLTLTQGGLDLNSNTINISNSAIGAMVRTGGYVKSEDIGAPYGTINWFINNTTGAHVYPFGVSATQYIPFTMNITVAGNRGVGTGYVPVSTYATAANNPPGEYPSGVTNLNGTSGGTSVTDRYWNITLGSAQFATTRPTSTITFTALNTEKPTTWTAIGEPPTNPNFLLAQRWNTAAYWDPAQTVPAQTYANNSPAAGTFQVGVPSVTSYSTSWTITDSSVPLPIGLVEFTAVSNSGVVELKWKTETEVDNDYFTVQRTSTGEKFEDVARVDGHGTSTQVNMYGASDYNASPGRWYYRLKQTDFDGKFSYSKLVAVDVTEVATWTVYPNPSDGNMFQVSFSDQDLGKPALVRLQDLNGRELHQYTTGSLDSRNVKIELPQPLSAGVYIITIGVEQRFGRQKMIVK